MFFKKACLRNKITPFSNTVVHNIQEKKKKKEGFWNIVAWILFLN